MFSRFMQTELANLLPQAEAFENFRAISHIRSF